MYLSRSQIEEIVRRLGQPRASLVLNGFFNQYRHTLSSRDVSALYDSEYYRRIANHPTDRLVGKAYRVNIYNRHTYDYIVPRLNENSRILDVGCGNGDFALALSTHMPQEVVGIDWGVEAISEAEEKLRGTNLSCRFVHGSVEDIPRNERFDFIVLNDISEHLSDAELTFLLTELRRLITPQGRLVIHTPNGMALCNATDANWLSGAYELYLRWRTGWQGVERDIDQLYYDQVHINIKSYRQLRRVLLANGFVSDVDYDEKRRWRFLGVLSSNMTVIAGLK